MNVDFKKRFLIDTAFVVLVVAIMYFLLKFCTLYLLPFVIGLLLAVLVQRPAKFMERKLKIKKSLVSVLFVLVLYLITLLLLSWLGVFIYNKASSFISAAPTYLTTFKDIFGDINARFSDLMTELPPSIASAIETMPDTILKKLTDVLTAVLSSSATIIAKDAPNLLITIIITVVASCYIAKDYDVIMAFLHKHVSSKVNRVISEIKKIFLESVFKLLKSYMLLMLITFAELSVGFAIIGVKNPVSVAAIVAFVDILPVLGTGAVVIPWAIISLISGNVWRAVGLAIIYIVVVVVRNFLEPKVIGDQIGMHPLITLLAIFVGLRLFGILGLFLCPIAIIVVYGLQKKGVINLFGKRAETQE